MAHPINRSYRLKKERTFATMVLQEKRTYVCEAWLTFPGNVFLNLQK